MQENYVIGIDAGGTKVAYGLFDGQGRLIDRIQHPTDAGADGTSFAETIIHNVNAFSAKHGLAPKDLRGVGLCMPSFILYEEGRILMTSAMPGIKDFPMRDYLARRLGARVALDNDSNAAALAEYRHGAGRGARHMVYVAIGTGIGSGIIIDGKLFQGSYGWAGECGHMLATPDAGVLCGCENRGCFMSYASGRYLPTQVQEKLRCGEHSCLSGCDCSGESILEAYKKGDKLAAGIIEQTAHYIAVCVFNMYQMLNINTFVFGGGLVHFGEALFGPLRSKFDEYNHIPLPVYFKQAELEQDFGIIGAAEFIREVV